MDGQIAASTTAAHLPDLDVGRVHPLTGPIYVNGAEVGDLLAVHILRIESSNRGFTATFPGRGFMPDIFPGPLLVHWDIADGFATSEQIPGVRIPGAPFLGTIGVAPSLDRLRDVNARESRLAETGMLVMAPRVAGALPADEVIAAEAWRTTAAHEVGGNMDLRQLVEDSVVYFPVDVAGALFSAGDGHFAQGDGETCGTAIEMDARVMVRIELHKGEAARRGQTTPTFTVPADRVSPATLTRYYATTGLSVSAAGEISYLGASLAARNALSVMVDRMTIDYGLSREQAYIVASVAGDLRISSIVNIPYAQVSMLVPEHIFT